MSSLQSESIFCLFSFQRFWSAFNSQYWCFRSIANFYFSFKRSSLSTFKLCRSLLNRYWNPRKNSSTRVGNELLSLYQKKPISDCCYSVDKFCSLLICQIMVPLGKLLLVDQWTSGFCYTVICLCWPVICVSSSFSSSCLGERSAALSSCAGTCCSLTPVPVSKPLTVSTCQWPGTVISI